MRTPPLATALLLYSATASAQMPVNPVRFINDPGKVTTGQSITPAGVASIFSGRVNGVVFGATAAEVWVLNGNKVFQLDWNTNRVISQASLGGQGGLQAIQYQAPGAVVAGTVGGKVQLLTVAAGKAKLLTPEVLGRTQAGAIAVNAKIAVVPLLDEHQVAVIDLASGAVLNRVDVGMVPFGAVVDAGGATAYVSNWGGRRPAPGDLSAAMGYRALAYRAVVDQRGIASTGTVTKIDLKGGKVAATIAAGLHPTAMVWDETRARLYVANGNQDSVSVIDTKSDKVAATINIRPFKENAFGVAPTALALSRDGGTLYVACGGLNAIAVFNAQSGKMLGMIPTAWYPSSLSMSADGKHLAVGTLLGIGSGANDSAPKERSVHNVRGSISVIEVPDAAQLASYTTAVAENNHLTLGTPGATPVGNPKAAAKAVPARAGEPSFVEHVVFIIKENRTYDQILGDLEKGNGQPNYAMFGRDVTPNQHKLAEQFVVLDNFFATGGNSADGHQWLTQANEVDYCLWPGYQGRSYPFDGSDPLAYSNGGFLWDAALRMKKSVRVYGEYAGSTGGFDRAVLLKQWQEGGDFSKVFDTVAPLAPLNKILAANFPSYTTQVPDVVRARIFLSDLGRWQEAGQMPNLTILSLPSNHTNGTQPDSSTAKAMVADNDLAVGQIVEALTKSRFWGRMAIFIVEDDAQGGVDHVDGHRTVALAVSPFIRRGAVDSTFYTQQSMVKTIELMLGLPTMSLFDLIAPSMSNSFEDHADLTAYSAVQPKQSLFEKNPPLKAMRGQQRRDAIASKAMRFDVPDAAPSEKLNRIIWRSAMGMNARYPKIRHSVFTPMAVEVDDDDR